MSPEQVRGDTDLDARTDVWSLGVTLCELLSLRSPYAADNAERTRRAVLEARPPRLRRDNPALPRDVEMVCLLAMRAVRADRYATMRAFAADLDNLLEHRPVLARPLTPLLALQRWAQRRPAAAIGALAAVLLLVVAPTVFWLQQRSANESIRQALAEARRHRDSAREAVETLLLRVGAEGLDQQPHMQGLRRDLLTAARAFHERFLADAEHDPELLHQAADSAMQLAAVDIELGRMTQAREEAQRAIVLARDLVARNGEDRGVLAMLAGATDALAAAEQSLGDLDGAARDIAAALAWQQRVVADDPGDVHATTELVSFTRQAAFLHGLRGDTDAATAAYRDIEAIWTRWNAVDAAPMPRSLRQILVGVIGDEAWFHERIADADAAKSTAERLLAWRDHVDAGTLSSNERVAVARACEVLSGVLRARDDLAAAENVSRRGLAEVAAVLSDLPQHANALRIEASTLNNLAFAVPDTPERHAERRGLFVRSIATLRRLIALDERVVEPRGNLATTCVNLAAMDQDAGELAAARELLREAAPLADRVRSEEPTEAKWTVAAENAWWILGQVAGQLRDPEEQASAAEHLAAVRPDDAHAQRGAGALMAFACRLLRDDPKPASTDRGARLVALQGRSLELLRHAAELGCADHAYLTRHADFDSVRDLPGFAAIVARMRENAAASGTK